jgi:hypothetical protein
MDVRRESTAGQEDEETADIFMDLRLE